MLVGNISNSRNFSAKLGKNDIDTIKIYMLGAVDAFCNVSQNNFSVKALFGGENRNWNHTPIQKIYDYYVSLNDPEAANKAAIDVGILLREILDEDVRWQYEMHRGYTNEYRRVNKK